MDDAKCNELREECRKQVYGAMFPRWIALVVISLFVAISGLLFGLSMMARAEASGATKEAAVQARDISHLAAGQARIEARLEKIQEMLEKK